VTLEEVEACERMKQHKAAIRGLLEGERDHAVVAAVYAELLLEARTKRGDAASARVELAAFFLKGITKETRHHAIEHVLAICAGCDAKEVQRDKEVARA
jgi:hypothetical protein